MRRLQYISKRLSLLWSGSISRICTRRNLESGQATILCAHLRVWLGWTVTGRVERHPPSDENGISDETTTHTDRHTHTHTPSLALTHNNSRWRGPCKAVGALTVKHAHTVPPEPNLAFSPPSNRIVRIHWH